MLVLIDASGSMSLPGPAGFPTRIAAARSLAKERVLAEANVTPPENNLRVSVYTFQGSSYTPRTTGFVDATEARTAIDSILSVSGSTPLAGSMCSSIDQLITTEAGRAILQVSSDGQENSTPSSDPCFGPMSGDPNEPFEPGSWQNKVYNKAIDNAIVRVDLFNSALTPIRDVETGRPIQHPNAAFQPPTLEQFFGAVARATGGRLTVFEDGRPLPIEGDFDGDRCVDRRDAALLARQIGAPLPGADGKFDLTLDSQIDYSDYENLISRITPNCGTPDPYVAAEPIDCHTSRVVIEGKALESGTITIRSRGACEIVIRNSLVVARQGAIAVSGKADFIIDNSVIVGEQALMATSGKTTVSASNSVFRGTRSSNGAFRYVDRGGNTWE